MTRPYVPSIKRATPRDNNVELPRRVEVGNEFVERVSRLEACLALLERAHDALAREVAARRKELAALCKRLNAIENGDTP